ncbi:NADH dehydrogenase ubiquinone Fe-S protein 4 [Enterovirga aerilata]|uniref:ETC complex I subunit n=1 Tax=Enterovirga aerilata TaxID=2730920 RepID=A0A849I5P4_9HYPH|nr:NADH dehydrogenase ubiquinone Fe-S protein 4 [Enterovirga sp. DB1703]NNM75186.1 hypothetical protein [Enterovirga sp. DB1703]
MEQIRTEIIGLDHIPALLEAAGLTGKPDPFKPAAYPAVAASHWRGDEQAIIFRRGRAPMTSGSAGAREWVLRFERRTAPFIEPLMGWTGGEEPLAQIELTFDSREAAIRYAEREGLSYRVEGEALAATAEQRREEKRREESANLFATAAALAWMDPCYGIASLGKRPDFDRALTNPAAVYAAPSEVLNDPSLSTEDKREILRRWAWDEWLLEVAADEAMAGGEPSRLDEVKAALVELDRSEKTVLLIAQNASASAAAQDFSGASDRNEFSVARRRSWGERPGSAPFGADSKHLA